VSVSKVILSISFPTAIVSLTYLVVRGYSWLVSDWWELLTVYSAENPCRGVSPASCNLGPSFVIEDY
jgi:hypothetical protein